VKLSLRVWRCMTVARSSAPFCHLRAAVGESKPPSGFQPTSIESQIWHRTANKKSKIVEMRSVLWFVSSRGALPLLLRSPGGKYTVMCDCSGTTGARNGWAPDVNDVSCTRTRTGEKGSACRYAAFSFGGLQDVIFSGVKTARTNNRGLRGF
jgi:hypothetical protein